jgi:uncharacterized protein (DUF2249 family)
MDMTELDVRTVPPPRKHAEIFRTFDALPEGGAFVLVNDHDPVPLRYEFELGRTGMYAWEVEDSGPELWRIRISRHAFSGQSEPRLDTLPPARRCCCGHH